MWYSKRRRAQNDQDFETWIEGGVCPTLNAFDNTGDSRATVLVFAPGPMVRLGGNIWEGIVPTLRAEAKRGDAEPHILIIDGTQVDDVRVYDGPVQTLKERMGTGGNNVPMVAIPIQDGREMEKKQNGLGVGGEGDPAYTLDQTGAQAVAYSIREDATANTFSATEIETALSLSAVRPSVQSHHAQTFITQAYDEYNDKLGGDVHHALRAGTKQSTGVLVNGEVAATLRLGVGGEGAAGFKAGQGSSAGSIGYQEGIAQTLTSNMNGVEPTVLTPTMQVRRLTPIECERLMGWPDNHTLHRADGGVNSDTTRYKMCGNGVASPVAQWIAEQILPIHEAL